MRYRWSELSELGQDLPVVDGTFEGGIFDRNGVRLYPKDFSPTFTSKSTIFLYFDEEGGILEVDSDGSRFVAKCSTFRLPLKLKLKE